jgi:hypothetical protein
MTTAPLSTENPRKPKSRYRAISGWAVASVVLGGLSAALMLGWLFAVLPLAGIFAGWMGLRQIGRFREEMTGMGMAQAGIALSVVFGLAGAGYLYFVVHKIPPGYTEISFADLQPDPTNKREWVPPYAFELQPTPDRDKKVFIKGYIHPFHQSRKIREFVLVPTLEHCSFCFWQIRSTELIQVKMTGDKTVDYTMGEVGVGGRLHVNENAAKTRFGGFPYVLEADCVQ